MKETELPVTPSVDVQEMITGLPIFVEKIVELPHRASLSRDQATYASNWKNIFPDTQLTSPILREEWVVRSQPPAKLGAFTRAKMFDIGDIANWFAILVSFF